MFRQKILLRFSKRGLLRFISHRDLMSLFERVLRRADLPLSMSEGFNPRPRMSFPLALGLGLVGENEVMEIQLDGWISPVRLVDTLQPLLPGDITLERFEFDHGGKFQARAADYRIELDQPLTDDRRRRLLELTDRETIDVTRTRKGKRPRQVDIRPYLTSIDIDDNRTVRLHTRVTPGGTLRVDEVFEAADIELTPADLVVREDVRDEVA